MNEQLHPPSWPPAASVQAEQQLATHLESSLKGSGIIVAPAKDEQAVLILQRLSQLLQLQVQRKHLQQGAQGFQVMPSAKKERRAD